MSGVVGAITQLTQLQELQVSGIHLGEASELQLTNLTALTRLTLPGLCPPASRSVTLHSTVSVTSFMVMYGQVIQPVG